MGTSDWISIFALLVSIAASYYAWKNEHRARKKELKDNNLAIDIEWSIRLYRTSPRSDAYSIPVHLHNTGGKMFQVRNISLSYLDEDEEMTIKSFNISNSRVFNPGSSIEFDCRHTVNNPGENRTFEVEIRELNAYIKVIEASVKVFVKHLQN